MIRQLILTLFYTLYFNRQQQKENASSNLKRSQPPKMISALKFYCIAFSCKAKNNLPSSWDFKWKSTYPAFGHKHCNYWSGRRTRGCPWLRQKDEKRTLSNILSNIRQTQYCWQTWSSFPASLPKQTNQTRCALESCHSTITLSISPKDVWYFQIVSESGENDHQRLKILFVNFLVNFLMEARQSWLSISLLILDLKSRHRGLFKCNGVDKIFPVVNWCAVHLDKADFDFANRGQPWKVFLIAFLFWSQQDFQRLQRYKTNSTMNTFLLAE